MSYWLNKASTDSLYLAGDEDSCTGALTRLAKTSACPFCRYNRDATISRKPMAMSDVSTGWGRGECSALYF
jgi:hypothetical protein